MKLRNWIEERTGWKLSREWLRIIVWMALNAIVLYGLELINVDLAWLYDIGIVMANGLLSRLIVGKAKK